MLLMEMNFLKSFNLLAIVLIVVILFLTYLNLCSLLLNLLLMLNHLLYLYSLYLHTLDLLLGLYLCKPVLNLLRNLVFFDYHRVILLEFM